MQAAESAACINRPTRELILETGLAMFNGAGEPNVTTNQIAGAMGISFGNLYYHLRGKDGIVGQLFARYEARADEALLLPANRMPNLEDIWLQMHLINGPTAFCAAIWSTTLRAIAQ